MSPPSRRKTKYVILTVTTALTASKLLLLPLQHIIGESRCSLIEPSQTATYLPKLTQELKKPAIDCLVIYRFNKLASNRENLLSQLEPLAADYDIKIIVLDFFDGLGSVDCKEVKLQLYKFLQIIRPSGIEHHLNKIGTHVIGKICQEYEAMSHEERSLFDLIVPLDLIHADFKTNLVNAIDCIHRSFPDLIYDDGSGLLHDVDELIARSVPQQFVAFYPVVLLQNCPVSTTTSSTSAANSRQAVSNSQIDRVRRQQSKHTLNSSTSTASSIRSSIRSSPDPGSNASQDLHTKKLQKVFIIPLTTVYTGSDQFLHLLESQKLFPNATTLKSSTISIPSLQSKIHKHDTLILNWDFHTAKSRKAHFDLIRKSFSQLYDLKFVILDFTKMVKGQLLTSLEYYQSCLRFTIANVFHLNTKDKGFSSLMFMERFLKDVASFVPLTPQELARLGIKNAQVIPMRYTNARFIGFLNSLGSELIDWDSVSEQVLQDVVNQCIEFDSNEQTFPQSVFEQHDFTSGSIAETQTQTQTQTLIFPTMGQALNPMKETRDTFFSLLSTALPGCIRITDIFKPTTSTSTSSSSSPDMKLSHFLLNIPSYVKFVIMDKANIPPSLLDCLLAARDRKNGAFQKFAALNFKLSHTSMAKDNNQSAQLYLTHCKYMNDINAPSGGPLNLQQKYDQFIKAQSSKRVDFSKYDNVYEVNHPYTSMDIPMRKHFRDTMLILLEEGFLRNYGGDLDFKGITELTKGLDHNEQRVKNRITKEGLIDLVYQDEEEEEEEEEDDEQEEEQEEEVEEEREEEQEVEEEAEDAQEYQLDDAQSDKSSVNIDWAATD